MMTLRQIRHFIAVAETGSISAAAQAVYISQSTLTLAIQHPHKHQQSPGPLNPPQTPGGPQHRQTSPQQQYSTSISADGQRQNFWVGLQDRRASISYPYEMESPRPPTNHSLPNEVKTFEWDEESIDQ